VNPWTRRGLAASMALALTAMAACGGAASPSATKPAASQSGSTSGSTSGSSSAPAASSSNPYVIHVILPLTGTAAFLGKQEAAALKIYGKQLAGKPLVGGRPVQFAIEDDQSSPQLDVQLLQTLMAQHPAVVLGPSLVASCAAAAPLVTDGPVLWCLSPGAYPTPNSYLFTVMSSAYDQIYATLVYFKDKGWKTLGSLVSTDASGQDGYKNLIKSLKAPAMSSMKLLDSESFNLTDLSVQAQMARIAAKHPQALFTWTTGAAEQTIFKAQQAVGLNIPSTGSSGNATSSEMDAFNATAPNNLFFAQGRWVAAGTLTGQAKQIVQNFISAMRAGGADPNLVTAAAWDAAHMVVAGLQKLGPGATATQLRDYLQNLKSYNGVWGDYSFSPSDHRGLHLSDTYVAMWNRTTKTFENVSGPGGVPLK
jgi:branched-chain amino acid transport system substrate-binding protein